MPTYEYSCLGCGAVFEKRLSFAEVDTIIVGCPTCGSGQVKRRINRVALKRGRSSDWLTRDQMNAALGYAQAVGGESLHGHDHEHAHDSPEDPKSR